MRRIAFVSVVSVLLSSRALAEETSTSRITESLEQRLSDLDAELQQLKSQYGSQPVPETVNRGDCMFGFHDAREPIQQAAYQSSDPPNHEYFLYDHSSDQPKYPTAIGSGFIHLDWGHFHQDAASRAAVGDIQDGAHFTRARVSVHGNAWEDVAYIIELDFGLPDRPSFVDVYLDLDTHTPLGHFRVGRWRQPFSMDSLTSIRELTFFERATLFAFSPFRQTGIGFYDQSDDGQMTWAVSGFRYPSDGFGTNLGDNGGYGLATRITQLLLDDQSAGQLIHIGASYSYADPSADEVRFRSTPEYLNSPFTGTLQTGVPNNLPVFVDTGALNTADQNLVGAELAALLGQLYVQSELVYAFIQQASGPWLGFTGLYIHTGYFLTGEVRQYNHKNGVFGRVKPDHNFGADGGFGAWEIAARWSYIDLNDRNIAGGRLNNITVGVNWYLNPRTKFQFNYIRAFLNDANQGNADTDIVAVRAQVDF